MLMRLVRNFLEYVPPGAILKDSLLCVESWLQLYGRQWNKKPSITLFKVFSMKQNPLFFLYKHSAKFSLTISYLKTPYYQKKTTLVQL